VKISMVTLAPVMNFYNGQVFYVGLTQLHSILEKL
jgi:hypothetical protein